MIQKDKAENPETEAPLAVDYAYWDVPNESCKVIYSLPLFHEIDFVVNEGYRKIPHGGIEVAGLLFGTIAQDSVRIEAFREIDCEHASGPSLSFSERDLAELQKQISSSASDRDLKNLSPIGWFLARTRSPLELTEAEANQFNRFFPAPFQLTVLVKPERFQPTRFGFLVRTKDGRTPSDATASAVILPLPGRSHKAGQLIPSLSAPAPSNTAKRTPERGIEKETGRPKVPVDHFEEEQDETPVEPTTPSPKVTESRSEPDSLPLNIWKIPPNSEEESEPSEQVEPQEPAQTAAERAARRQLSRDRARIIEQAFPHPSPPAPAPFRPPSLPSLPANAAIPVVPSAYDRYPPAAEQSPVTPAEAAESVLNPRSVTALALAALLGCLVGYIAYLQLPAPVIPIDVRSVNQTIVVSWPPDETRNSIYAAIRLNDGPPVPLSAEEKRAGQVSLTATRDFKVEVMARNWIRDSRGIVRYLHSANGNGQVIPSDSSYPAP